MISKPLGSSAGALGAAVVCLSILFGMLVGHAWPLWFGRTILLPAAAASSRGSMHGDYVNVTTPAMTLVVRADGTGGSATSAAVRPVGPWWNDPSLPPVQKTGRMRGTLLYVQLEPSDGGDYRPVTVSRQPVPGAVNLRGVIRRTPQPDTLSVEYGLDAFYMKQGKPEAVAAAFRAKRRVQLEVAVASSGRARIRSLLIDGVPVSK